MKRIIAASLILGAYLTACNNDTNTGEGVAGGSDTTSTATTANPDTGTATSGTMGMQSNMPFMNAMNNMMKQMHGMQPTGDADHDFATMMRMHHQGAVDMSNIELQQGGDNTLKQRAQKIIDDAQKDIKELDSFLSSYQAKPANSDYGKKAMDLMMKSHSDSMMQMHSGDIDRQFANTMHMHHQQGIDMSREYLKSAHQAIPRKVANRVIQTNGDDNKVLKSWMNKKGSDTTARTSM